MNILPYNQFNINGNILTFNRIIKVTTKSELDEAFNNLQNNDCIFIANRISIASFTRYDFRKVNTAYIIGDYETLGSGLIGNFGICCNNLIIIGIELDGSGYGASGWDEMFAYCNNLKMYNCIFTERNSSYSFVYYNFYLYNCYIKKVASIYSPTYFYDCAFYQSTAGGTHSNSIFNITDINWLKQNSKAIYTGPYKLGWYILILCDWVYESEVHNTDVIVTGTISQNIQIKYKVELNNLLYQDYGEFIQCPTTISFVIKNSDLLVGVNQIKITFLNLNNFETVDILTITKTNKKPLLTYSLDRYVTYQKDINLIGVFTDEDNDPVSYKVLLNETLYRDWYTSNNVSLKILNSDLKVGNNKLKIVYDDTFEQDSIVIDLYKKALDCTYFTQSTNNYNDTKLKVDVDNVSLIKLPTPDEKKGYLKTVKLNLNVLKNDGQTGELKIAPLLSFWTGEDLTIVPLFGNPITKILTNVGGAVEIDISELSQNLQNGIIIYSTGFATEFDSINISYSYVYAPTVLLRPKQVWYNRVLLEWKPIILEKPMAFVKYRLLRGQKDDLSDAQIIFESTDISITKYEDHVPTGTYYYRLDVIYVDNLYQGDRLNFNDSSQFIISDIQKIEFVGGAVRMKYYPSQTITFDFTTDIGLTYDNTQVIVDGLLRLKELN
ncbi:MAG: hypothetical protein QXI16_01520 [Sulfolobaceae archaeon]